MTIEPAHHRLANLDPVELDRLEPTGGPAAGDDHEWLDRDDEWLGSDDEWLDGEDAPAGETGAPGQSRWSRLLWGDENRGRGTGRSRRRRTRRDPSLPAMWQARAMRGGLLALLTIGATGGAKALVWPSGDTTVAATTAAGGGDDTATQHIGVGGFGELYVSAWLSAGRDSEDVLAPYYPEPVNLAQIESGVFWASRTATVEVSVEGEDYWSVVVAADVLRAGDGGAFEPAGIRFFGFGVVRDVDGFVATSLPAQVPPPPTIEVPERVIDGLERPGGELEAVAQALDHFFAALLAGSGDLERYLSPDAQLAAIAPAPFAETEVRSLGARPEAADPSRLLVRAEVVGRDGGGAGQVLSYTVTVRQRAGRWEVVELVPATPLVGVEAPAGAGDGRPETGSTSTSIEKED